MNMRSSRSILTFRAAFALPGYTRELPAGDYEVVVEEELFQGLSFEAWRRTATFLTVSGRGGHPGRIELQAISDSDLNEALSRDAASNRNDNIGEPAPSPREDGT
ncbi:MAG: hypothetical protein NXH83_19445 [Rhodobacteraceae bacterium]|nr:hypothetical protein [Paracoccaceae bacterium]